MSQTQSGPIRPLALRKEGDQLAIEWSDGLHSALTWELLRRNCPCANCREERQKPPDPFRILSPKELEPRPPLAPVAMSPVGHYAYKIIWNDGHDAGIYTIENLRELCDMNK